ncbi:MAG: hypothetical protein ACREQB_02290 [Candidatus Binataceae bacterium]
MQTATERTPQRSHGARGVVYRIHCQNPGCGFKFDLRITPENAGVLGGSIPCPRCRRHGGYLKSQGRIGEKLFAAKLLFRVTGVATPSYHEEEDGLRD